VLQLGHGITREIRLVQGAIVVHGGGVDCVEDHQAEALAATEQFENNQLGVDGLSARTVSAGIGIGARDNALAFGDYRILVGGWIFERSIDGAIPLEVRRPSAPEFDADFARIAGCIGVCGLDDRDQLVAEVCVQRLVKAGNRAAEIEDGGRHETRRPLVVCVAEMTSDSGGYLSCSATALCSPAGMANRSHETNARRRPCASSK